MARDLVVRLEIAGWVVPVGVVFAWPLSHMVNARLISEERAWNVILWVIRKGTRVRYGS
jgi:hypothetical protein